MKKYLRNNTAIIILSSILIITFAWSTLKVPSIGSPSNQCNINNSILIHPLSKPLFYNNYEYPHINTNPSKKYHYHIITIWEKINVLFNVYDNKFVSSKKINELRSWSDQIPSEYKLNQIHNISGLLNYWEINGPSMFEINKFNNYNSWESILSRYYLLSSKSISVSKRTDFNSEIGLDKISHKYLLDYSELIKTILNSNKSNDEKTYLIKLVNIVFFELNEKMFDKNLDFNHISNIYPLSEISNTIGPGSYKFSYKDNSRFSPTADSIMLRLGQNDYSSSYSVNPSTVYFNNVSLSPNENKNFLKLKNTNQTVPNLNVSNIISTYKKDNLPYEVYFQKDLLLTKGSYSFNVKHTDGYPLIIIIFGELEDGKKIEIDSLDNENLYYSSSIQSTSFLLNIKEKVRISKIQILNTFDYNSNNLVRTFSIHANPSLLATRTSCDDKFKIHTETYKLSTFKFLLSISNANILTKNDLISTVGFGWKTQLVSDSNSNTTYNLYFWPGIYSFRILTFMILIFLLFNLDLFITHNTNLYRPYIKLKKYLYQITDYAFPSSKKYLLNLKITYWSIVLKIKYCILTLSIILFILDIVSANLDNFVFLVIKLFFWALSILLFKFNKKILQLLTFLFLALVPFSLTFKLFFIAEKLSSWSFIFLLITIIHISIKCIQKEYIIKDKS